LALTGRQRNWDFKWNHKRVKGNHMYEFTVIIASIAFFLSLIAFLNVSTKLDRAEQKNEKFVKEHIDVLIKEIKKNAEKADFQNKKISKLDTLLDGTLVAQKKVLGNQHLISEDIEKLSNDLKDLETSIPSKFKTNRPKDL